MAGFKDNPVELTEIIDSIKCKAPDFFLIFEQSQTVNKRDSNRTVP
jgi:hypothetical protein